MSEQGLIYALSEGTLPATLPADEAFYIKIGFTSSDSAESRRGSCQTGNPRPLVVVKEFPGQDFDEKTLHSVLHKYRQVGEWFLLPSRILRRLRYKRIKTSAALIEDLKKQGEDSWYHTSFRDGKRQERLANARARGEQMINTRSSLIRAAVADLKQATQETLSEVDGALSSASNITDPGLRDELLNHYLDIRADVGRRTRPRSSM